MTDLDNLELLILRAQDAERAYRDRWARWQYSRGIIEGLEAAPYSDEISRRKRCVRAWSNALADTLTYLGFERSRMEMEWRAELWRMKLAQAGLVEVGR